MLCERVRLFCHTQAKAVVMPGVLLLALVAGISRAEEPAFASCRISKTRPPLQSKSAGSPRTQRPARSWSAAATHCGSGCRSLFQRKPWRSTLSGRNPASLIRAHRSFTRLLWTV